jgi:N-methylhydantoinase B
MHIGSLPGYLRGIEKTIPLDAWKRGRLRAAQPSLFRRQPLARHRRGHADLLQGRAGRLLGQHRAPCRHRRGDARPDHRRAGHVRRGHADECPQALRGGKRNETIWNFIRNNTRVPSLVMGDLEAQIASAELGVRRFQELLDTYGKEDVHAGDAPADGLHRGDAAPRDREDPRRRLHGRGLPRRRRPQPRQDAADQGDGARRAATASRST